MCRRKKYSTRWIRLTNGGKRLQRIIFVKLTLTLYVCILILASKRTKLKKQKKNSSHFWNWRSLVLSAFSFFAILSFSCIEKLNDNFLSENVPNRKNDEKKTPDFYYAFNSDESYSAGSHRILNLQVQRRSKKKWLYRNGTIFHLAVFFLRIVCLFAFPLYHSLCINFPVFIFKLKFKVSPFAALGIPYVMPKPWQSIPDNWCHSKSFFSRFFYLLIMHII